MSKIGPRRRSSKRCPNVRNAKHSRKEKRKKKKKTEGNAHREHKGGMWGLIVLQKRLIREKKRVWGIDVQGGGGGKGGG